MATASSANQTPAKAMLPDYFHRMMRKYVAVDLTTASGRSVVEERYWSLRRQVPIVYLLGFVNLSAMELSAIGRLAIGANLPTFIAGCGILRLFQWFRSAGAVTHEVMVRRLQQTVIFAAIVCFAVCARCLQLLLQSHDTASHMAVMLFGGLTAIGVAYGLTALPAAGRIPLILIIGPISAVALFKPDHYFRGAAFGLVAVAVLTMRLLAAHSRHFTDVVRSRSAITRKQRLVEQAHQEAVVAATTDFLTGLPNRRAFVAAVDEMAGREGECQSFAVAVLDLDRFKAVNDTFGHAVGDQLLCEVASRLVEALGNRGLVARLGGDEFGLLLPGINRPAVAKAIGREITERVNGPAFLEGRQLIISACCGLALGNPSEGKTPSRLMADADVALYQAKASLADKVAIFERRMDAPRRRRTQIEGALLSPDIYEKLHIAFQPIIDLRTGGIIANEALARWSDPRLGSISPAEFVPIAEHLNLIDQINNHLMALAFREACRWPHSTKLSFNLSAIQICTSGFAKSVLKSLASTGLGPDRLQVEVTETALLADFERARTNLDQLRQAGATIVLDDFGAGFASIGYLRELSFDQIKLDGGLVTAAQHGADGKRLLQAVIALCEILGVASIAEHVESKELLDLVTALGCTGGQGFWLGRPTAAPKFDYASTRPMPARSQRAA